MQTVRADADGRTIYRAVQEFAATAHKIGSMADLSAAVADISAWLGFDRFAIVNHVDFGRIVPGIRLTNYPVEFIGRLRELGLTRDPVLRASERAGVGFSWDQIPTLISLREGDHAYMREAAKFGLVNGFTVPNNIPGEILGSCHFAVGADPLPRAHFAAAQSVGAFGFEAARRLAGEMTAQGPSPDPAPLSQRQRDCLIQVARGKSDGVIAEILGLRPRTVNEYVEAAKRRYVVATRQQLVVRALFSSEISFSEVLH
ncbi:helix-turn-helix transcriptional regulator [Sphingomonas solaris]|uniref:LuxR family transcriptional regulator n=1 Tax=Alterirhizorhabdus solaris TaxID=2529389 RepID=A0A558QZW7_9SPHN|nr:LuxR family transcriptional regulator [Sphingomonas solaris]TVV72675.1 LuxR family transcriptional regulator [Sphingomonas solaris]